jgi:undecaprenyl-diphosphatase
MLWDLTGFYWLNSYVGVNPKWDSFFIFISDRLLYVCCAIVLLFFVLWKKPIIYKIKIFGSFVLSAIFSYAVVYLVFHQIWPRSRPFDSLEGVKPLVKESGLSFPSKHAMGAFLLATFTFLYNKKLGVLIFFLSIFVAVGRVFVGVHYPTDVIAGALFGIVVGLLFGNKIKE